jgi:hypothetical protein
MLVLMQNGYTIDYSKSINYLRAIRRDDFINEIKENGYESIHLHAVGPKGAPLNIQIRTEAMHRTAERGSAAHDRYKVGALGLQMEERRDSSPTPNRYAAVNGKIYKVRPADSHKTPVLLDLAFAAGEDAGLRCPNKVGLQRISPITGEITKRHASIFEPLSDGDHISFKLSPRKITSAVRREACTTLSAKRAYGIHGKVSHMDIEESKKRGGEKLKVLAEKAIKNARTAFGHYAAEAGASSLHPTVYFSWVRLAKLISSDGFDSLCLDVEINRDSDALLRRIEDLFPASCVAAAHKIRPGAAHLYFMINNIPGVLNALFTIIEESSLVPAEAKIRPFDNNNRLWLEIIIRPSKRGGEFASDESLQSLTDRLDDLYKKLKPRIPNGKDASGTTATLSFQYKRLSPQLIKELEDRFLRIGARIIKADFVPGVGGGASCEIKIVSLDKRSIRLLSLDLAQIDGVKQIKLETQNQP